MLGTKQTYIDMERLIHRVVTNVSELTGLDHDDLMGAAHEGFLRAADVYDPSRGAFSTLCWTCVRNACGTEAARLIRRRSREIQADETRYAETETSHPKPVGRTKGEIRYKSGFDLQALLADLSEDARIVCRLLFDEDLRPIERLNGIASQKTLAKIRSTLWNDWNWGMDRITESFAEIREALR